MNSNRGLDPMLSSLVGDSMWNTKIIAEPVACSLDQLTLPEGRMVSPVPDVLLSPESNPSYSDLEFLWGNERKRVTSIKIEEDDTFSSSPCSLDEVESSEMDMEDCDIKSEIHLSMMEDDVHDSDTEMPLHRVTNDNNFLGVSEFNSPPKRFNMSEADARKHVDISFSKIAFVPHQTSSHREKIQYILSLSDCAEYTVDDILSLDKRSADSARVCAKIVQNIPQRYRWECVKPEDIPCCYTIVADCKKLSNRDKPPRPMNAFMIWAQGARRLINELCPKMQNAAISEALGFYWRQKSDVFKKGFEMEKIKLRRFHNVEFPQYKYKPKTKIQKAKEKKELSLSKCKLSKAAIKREKLEESDLNVTRRKSKYGRPRKVKQIFEPDQKIISKPIPAVMSKGTDADKSSPTKPAIKDMLTLKILNDRRSKGMTIVKPSDSIQNCLGQLSPLEVENPATGDIFDEPRDYESRVGGLRDHHSVDSCGRFLSSSVYDTPANTPPIDENDHPLSPINHHHHHNTSAPSSSSSTSSSSSIVPATRSPLAQRSKLDRPNNCSTTQLSPRETMPSLKAILSSGSPITRQSSQLRRDLPGSRTGPSGHINGYVRTGSQAADYARTAGSQGAESGITTDLMLSYVSEILSSPDCGNGKSKGRAVNHAKGRNNNNNANNQGNVCDVNNNCSRQFNNNINNNNNSCVDLNHSPGSDALRAKSPPAYHQTHFDFGDLDTLSLDLHVPLLSDDIMKSLLNTL